jgi:hypothetical protein
VVGTDSCQNRHIGVAQSGRLKISHEDGTEQEIAAGDAYVIEPGHDAWVVGDEAFVGFEFEPRAAECVLAALPRLARRATPGWRRSRGG